MAIIDITKLEDAASRLRAIAHPMRIAIIGLLENHKTLNVTEIYDSLKIEQATASHHLSILKDKGVLTYKRDGKKIFYSLNHQTLSKIIECTKRCHS